MKTQVRLNLYERGIVQSLSESFGFTEQTAREIVVRYIKVIRKLGGYDTCRDHAERLVEAQRIGYTPEAWLERIRKIEREEVMDKTIARSV